MTDIERLLRGTRHVFSREELAARLAAGKPLRVKFGVDPTAPDLHLGHSVPLNKLRQFQDQGHTAVLIIGDYTARIGDPSGRSEARPPLSAEAVAAHAQTYLDQVFLVLDPRRTEVRRNADWLAPLFENRGADPRRTILGLMGRHTVQQLTEREDFQKRLASGAPVSLLELLYPLLQGFDSVAVDADVEIGGTDQLFNLLMGREMQKAEGRAPQVVLTLPLLEGADGVRKMSKSYGNAVGLRDLPSDMFGRLMSLPDVLMWKYYELLTDEDLPTVQAGHPLEMKKRLAGLITARFHGEAASAEARAGFEKIFSRRETPEDIPEHRLSKTGLTFVELLVECGVAPSKNEARRLIGQGAVEWDGVRVSADRPVTPEAPTVLKAGKRQFRRILPA